MTAPKSTKTEEQMPDKDPEGEQLDPMEAMEEAHKELRPGQRIPIRWEYHRMIVRDTAARIPLEDLNSLGRQGWELISIFHLHADLNFVFKRMDLP
jgi:hypothetical protein